MDGRRAILFYELFGGNVKATVVEISGHQDYVRVYLDKTKKK
jgi:hypothetical protein